MSADNLRPLTPQAQRRVFSDLAMVVGKPGIEDPAFLRAAIQDALGTLAMLEDRQISQPDAIARIRRDLRPCVPLRLVRAAVTP